MNFANLKDLTNSIKGTPLNLKDVSGSMASCLYELYNSSTARFGVLSSLISAWSVPGALITQDEANEIFDVFTANEDGISVTTDTFKSLVLDYDDLVYDGDDCYGFYLNNDANPFLVLRKSDKLIKFQNVVRPTKWSDGTDLNLGITELTTHISDGVHLSKLFADCTQMVSTGDVENEPQAVSNIVVQTIHASNVSSAIKTWLIQSAAQGPKSFVQAIQQVLVKANSNADSVSEGGQLLDTSFMVSQFSWGIVGKAVIGLAQVAAAVLFAFGTVAKVISVIASAALSLISNIIGGVVGAANDAIFICNHWNGIQGFDVVLNEFEIINTYMADAIRASGSTSFTAVSDWYPATIIGYLKYPDIDNDNTIVIQELPSINFSFLAYGRFESLTNFDRFRISNDIVIVPYNSGVQSPAQTLTFSWSKSIIKATMNSNASVIGYSSCPVSMDAAYIFNKMREALTTDMIAETNNVWAERMYTSIILWLFLKLSPLMNGMIDAYERGGHTANEWYQPMGWYMSTNVYYYMNDDGTRGDPYAAADWSVMKHMFMLFYTMQYQYIRGLYDIGTFREKSTISFPSDDLINNFEGFFANMKWKDYRADYDTLPFGLGMNNIVCVQDVMLAYEVQLELWTDWIENSICVWNENLLDIFLPEDSFQPGISKHTAVHVPRATMSSVMLGILVDIAIMAAVAVVAIIAVKVGTKIRNSMMRKATEIEAYKYAYENTVTGTKEDPVTHEQVPYTKAEQEAAWKQYKKSKFKYNVLAMFTGSPKAEQTPFGDFGSTDDTTNTVLNGLQGPTSSLENMVTLPDIQQQIAQSEADSGEIISLIRGPISNT